MVMPNFHRAQSGVSLVEVLIAMVILAIGLLGLVGLQGRLHTTQVESYQRAQALMLLQDMANRMMLNRISAASYVTPNPLGAGAACPVPNATRIERDLKEWCEALQGAAESLGGAQVGALVGGRGCVEQVNADEYLVTVAWQGMGPIAAPPDSVTCGEGEYDSADDDAPCVNDLCRRVVTTVVRISDLTPIV
jgi:type IV pilus assembly protein PilV